METTRLFAAISERSGVDVDVLFGMSWNDIVKKVILPKIAGMPNRRTRINSEFMMFMALYATEISEQDIYLGKILLEIGMQRLSCGAVLHDPTPTFEALPKEFHPWASVPNYEGCEFGGLGSECYAFITNALPLALTYEQTRDHALAILFGLMEHLTPQGKAAPESPYILGTATFKPDGRELFALAEQLCEQYATAQELFKHYAKPNQWRKHMQWFHNQTWNSAPHSAGLSFSKPQTLPKAETQSNVGDNAGRLKRKSSRTAN